MYSEHSIRQKRNNLIDNTKYKHFNQEGIFLGKNGKYIVNVKCEYKGNGSYIKKISQHITKEEAEIAYNNYYSDLKK